jgi:hypothetical protein
MFSPRMSETDRSNRCEFAARAIDEIGRLVGGWRKASRAVNESKAAAAHAL